MTVLKDYAGDAEQAAELIRAFWRCHNGYEQHREETLENVIDWTREGHRFYFIEEQEQTVGFVHLGSRGGECDWLEDLFVLPQYQRRGIGARAVALAEKIVKEYSDSLYLEAAARNEGAIRLYRKLGYDCLNTVTLRKDFHPEEFERIRTAQIYEQEFEIRRVK